MNPNQIQTASGRKTWIDATKVLSTFMILFIHTVSNTWSTTPVDTVLWKVSHAPFLFARCCVMVFFMCSGSTIFNRERSFSDMLKKNIFQLVKVYSCWMLIYGLKSCISMYQEGLASIRTCFNALVKAVLFGHYHTWFVFTLVTLYLITPFLYLILQSKKNQEIFLGLSILFTILIPSLRYIDSFSRLSDSLDNFNMTFVTGYVLYYVAGYYLTNLDWKPKYTYLSLLCFIGSFGTAYYLTMQESVKLQAPWFEIFTNFSPLAFLVTVSFFGIMRGMEQVKFPSFIAKLSPYGFAIYLMHPLFIEFTNRFSGVGIFIVIPLFYLFCLCICLLLSKNKILSYLFLK